MGNTYYSTEFNEELTIEKRMAKTVAVMVYSRRRGPRWWRWSRQDCAIYLRACKFRPLRRKEPYGV